MRHTFFTVTVINRWNNLPRDVVDSLSFKRFTSTLDTFQRDKPVSQTDVENTGWGSLSGVCKKSDWMLITAAQHCTSTKQFCKCSALQGPIISWPSYLSFGCSSVQTEQRLSAKSIFLSGRWNKNPFRTDMGIFKDHPMFTVWHHHCRRPNYIKTVSKHTLENCLSTGFAWCFYPRNICWADSKLVMGESIYRPCKMLELLVSRLPNGLST